MANRAAVTPVGMAAGLVHGPLKIENLLGPLDQDRSRPTDRQTCKDSIAFLGGLPAALVGAKVAFRETHSRAAGLFRMHIALMVLFSAILHSRIIIYKREYFD